MVLCCVAFSLVSYICASGSPAMTCTTHMAVPKIRGPSIDPNSSAVCMRTPTSRTPNLQQQPYSQARPSVRSGFAQGGRSLEA